MEIKHKVAQNYTADTHIWAETAALKGVLQKIESLNETAKNPEILLAKDEAKHKPVIDKWINATTDLFKRYQTEKNLKNLSSAMKDDLQTTDDMRKMKNAENNHLHLRPKIGHTFADDLIDKIDRQLKQWNEISLEEKLDLDNDLAVNNRFFSIFD